MSTGSHNLAGRDLALGNLQDCPGSHGCLVLHTITRVHRIHMNSRVQAIIQQVSHDGARQWAVLVLNNLLDDRPRRWVAKSIHLETIQKCSTLNILKTKLLKAPKVNSQKKGNLEKSLDWTFFTSFVKPSTVGARLRQPSTSLHCSSYSDWNSKVSSPSIHLKNTPKSIKKHPEIPSKTHPSPSVNPFIQTRQSWQTHISWVSGVGSK